MHCGVSMEKMQHVLLLIIVTSFVLTVVMTVGRGRTVASVLCQDPPCSPRTLQTAIVKIIGSKLLGERSPSLAGFLLQEMQCTSQG